MADLRGKILAFGKSGPSAPRNVGIETTAKNIAAAIERVLTKAGKDKKILSTYIGLAGVEEEFKFRKAEIKRELLKQKEISKIFKGKVIIGSDQIAAFRAGADKKDGIMLIAGTGASCHGWRGKKEAKVSGWGYLTDEGSALSVGRKVFQAIFREIDGRGPKTILTNLVFRKLKLKTKEELLSKVYSENWAEIIPSFSVYCDIASKRGDAVSKKIMEEAAEELALSVKTAIKKLNFQKAEFPLVMVGGMFKSKIVSDVVRKEAQKSASKTQFILVKKEPVIGAVKLAIESLKLK
jgi:N-acetylglucosamine kinase-like BadF-type ATPase